MFLNSVLQRPRESDAALPQRLTWTIDSTEGSFAHLVDRDGQTGERETKHRLQHERILDETLSNNQDNVQGDHGEQTQ